MKIFQTTKLKPEHLYIHYPFCKKKCSYCDFISFPKHENFIENYHETLSSEITTFAKKYPQKLNIKTIFLGGGTPSLYPLDLFSNLHKTLNQNFLLSNAIENTIEVNPGDVTKKHLQAYKNLGINRLSIGVQLLDEKILHNLNRHQTNQEVIDLLQTAPTYFDNISIDLILGLPGTTTKIWFDTLDYLTNQPITHISIYFLTIYEKTPLHFQIKANKITLPDEAWLIKTYHQTIDYLAKKNFLQYEISNFSKPGFASIHNQAYWDLKPYQGFGLSAASFDGKKRLVNSNNLIEYLNYGANLAPAITEELTPQQIILEELMLSLRQNKGIDLHRMIYLLHKGCKPAPGCKPIEKITQLKKQKLVEEKNGRIFLTTRGMVLENEIIIRLLA